MADKKNIEASIKKVEHPEIAMPLVDLGMVRDIDVQDDGVTFTLVIPFMGIPDVIRDMMIGSVRKAIEEEGSTLKDVAIETMTDAEREAFFQKEQSNWRQ